MILLVTVPLAVFAQDDKKQEEKKGELFEGDTLDQIWPVQKKLEKPFWWDNDPPSAARIQN